MKLDVEPSSMRRIGISGSSGYSFPRLSVRTVNGLLAQLVEQVTLNHRVVGSIPTQPTFFIKTLWAKLASTIQTVALERLIFVLLLDGPAFYLKKNHRKLISPGNWNRFEAALFLNNHDLWSFSGIDQI